MESYYFPDTFEAASFEFTSKLRQIKTQVQSFIEQIVILCSHSNIELKTIILMAKNNAKLYFFPWN